MRVRVKPVMEHDDAHRIDLQETIVDARTETVPHEKAVSRAKYYT